MKRLREAFTVDIRSLALFRIVLAGVLLVDLAIRAEDIEAWYTDFGFSPAALVKNHFTFHALSGSLGYEAFLFSVEALFILALLVGFHTRLAILGCLVFTVSLLNRNSEIQGSAVTALKLAIFWSLFLPLGERWSIDSLRRTPLESERARPSPANAVLTIGTVAILLQVFVIYPMAVYAKLKPPCCWRTLTAVQQILHDDRVNTGLSRLLLRIPWAHKPLTASVLIMEGVPPVIALAGRRQVRTAAAIAMMILHAVMIPAFVDVGLTFPMIMTTLWIVYLPAWFWDEALPSARAFLARKLPRGADAFGRGRAVCDAWLAKIPRRPDPEPKGPKSEVAAAAGSVFVVASMLTFVVASAPKFITRRTGAPPKLLLTFAKLAGLRQGWGLYVAKHASRQVIYAATLADGSRVDLRRGGAPLDWTRRADQTKNGHWTKTETNLKSNASLAERFADYEARLWDRDHPKNPVAEIELVIKKRYVNERWTYLLVLQRDFPPDFDPTVASPRKRRRLKADEEQTVRVVIDPRRLEGRSTAGSAESDDLLVPLATTEGASFLAPAGPLLEVGGRRGEAVFRCTLTSTGTKTAPRVKFDPESPWLTTRGPWIVGSLDECARGNRRVRDR